MPIDPQRQEQAAVVNKTDGSFSGKPQRTQGTQRRTKFSFSVPSVSSVAEIDRGWAILSNKKLALPKTEDEF